MPRPGSAGGVRGLGRVTHWPRRGCGVAAPGRQASDHGVHVASMRCGSPAPRQETPGGHGLRADAGRLAAALDSATQRQAGAPVGYSSRGRSPAAHAWHGTDWGRSVRWAPQRPVRAPPRYGLPSARRFGLHAAAALRTPLAATRSRPGRVAIEAQVSRWRRRALEQLIAGRDRQARWRRVSTAGSGGPAGRGSPPIRVACCFSFATPSAMRSPAPAAGSRAEVSIARRAAATAWELRMTVRWSAIRISRLSVDRSRVVRQRSVALRNSACPLSDGSWNAAARGSVLPGRAGAGPARRTLIPRLTTCATA